ncbi:cytochrome c [Chlorobium sp. N1]|uniref:c-type cytochrome n=1 Tax=Chlorobium sp. N1 TaxID=2491138 RepID=UPI0010408FCA|nr:cytochrome c [Chlorobium sp. N1]TCD48048.1 cytochrome c [Chlorobium sp. N1]
MKRTLLPLAAGIFLAAATTEVHASEPDGKAVFERNCSVCHSVAPPPKSAPPIIPIATRYRMKFPSKEQGVLAMTAFMQSPSKASSIVDPQAVQRFGLMPSMSALPEADLKAVAGWIWEQGGAGTGTGRGAGMGRGQGSCR